MNLELVTYVHTEHNLDAYITAHIASEAFLNAVDHPCDWEQPCAAFKVVVPILLTGHYPVFGWYQEFLSSWGVHNRLFVMASMLPEVFPIDPHASDNIMREFYKQLVAGSFEIA
jgi:hypothetical protein